jgi:hypothetical protein
LALPEGEHKRGAIVVREHQKPLEPRNLLQPRQHLLPRDRGHVDRLVRRRPRCRDTDVHAGRLIAIRSAWLRRWRLCYPRREIGSLSEMPSYLSREELLLPRLRLFPSPLSVSIVLSLAAMVFYLVAEVIMARSASRVLDGGGTPWWRDLASLTALGGLMLAGLGIKAGIDAVRAGSAWRRLVALGSIALAGLALLLNGFMALVDQIAFA